MAFKISESNIKSNFMGFFKDIKSRGQIESLLSHFTGDIELARCLTTSMFKGETTQAEINGAPANEEGAGANEG